MPRLISKSECKRYSPFNRRTVSPPPAIRGSEESDRPNYIRRCSELELASDAETLTADEGSESNDSWSTQESYSSIAEHQLQDFLPAFRDSTPRVIVVPIPQLDEPMEIGADEHPAQYLQPCQSPTTTDQSDDENDEETWDSDDEEEIARACGEESDDEQDDYRYDSNSEEPSSGRVSRPQYKPGFYLPRSPPPSPASPLSQPKEAYWHGPCSPTHAPQVHQIPTQTPQVNQISSPPPQRQWPSSPSPLPPIQSPSNPSPLAQSELSNNPSLSPRSQWPSSPSSPPQHQWHSNPSPTPQNQAPSNPSPPPQSQWPSGPSPPPQLQWYINPSPPPQNQLPSNPSPSPSQNQWSSNPSPPSRSQCSSSSSPPLLSQWPRSPSPSPLMQLRSSPLPPQSYQPVEQIVAPPIYEQIAAPPIYEQIEAPPTYEQQPQLYWSANHAEPVPAHQAQRPAASWAIECPPSYQPQAPAISWPAQFAQNYQPQAPAASWPAQSAQSYQPQAPAVSWPTQSAQNYHPPAPAISYSSHQVKTYAPIQHESSRGQLVPEELPERSVQYRESTVEHMDQDDHDLHPTPRTSHCEQVASLHARPRPVPYGSQPALPLLGVAQAPVQHINGLEDNFYYPCYGLRRGAPDRRNYSNNTADALISHSITCNNCGSSVDGVFIAQRQIASVTHLSGPSKDSRFMIKNLLHSERKQCGSLSPGRAYD